MWDRSVLNLIEAFCMTKKTCKQLKKKMYCHSAPRTKTLKSILSASSQTRSGECLDRVQAAKKPPWDQWNWYNWINTAEGGWIWYAWYWASLLYKFARHSIRCLYLLESISLSFKNLPKTISRTDALIMKR